MNTWDNQYLNLMQDILDNGIEVPCRTGDIVRKKLNCQLSYDLDNGFPLLTFRPLPFKGCRVELSGFLQGITDKKWYQDNGCKYWDSWCNPEKVPYSDKEGMKQERDLGSIYGFEWRHFDAEYENYDTNYTGKGFDQLQAVIDKLKTDPYDRRMIISAWNPNNNKNKALPPCLYLYQFTYLGGRLHINAKMRSTDLVLGCPTDFASTALFLMLVAQTVGMKPGTVCLDMTDCHIYENHIPVIQENLENWRKNQFELPQLILNPTATVFNFTWDMAKLENYRHGEKISFDVAI